jgi:mono/diheme cytochrome c family protein
MLEETQTSPVSEQEAKPRKNILLYLVLGGGFVIILILVTVTMLIVTGKDVTETKAPVSIEGSAAEGKALYLMLDCSSCHPAEGRAGGIGPRLSTTNLTDDSIRNIILKGKGAMPGYRFSENQLNKMIAYIRALKPV